MKKFTSIILMIALLLGIGEFTNLKKAEAFENEFDLMLLSTLGIISEKDIENAEKTVTRRDFALFTARALAIDEYANTQKRYYVDVSVDDYAAGAINSLVDMGILSVSEERKFHPDSLVTITEACKMLTYALGYSEYINVAGGYPTGVLKAAQNAKLTSGVGTNMNLYSTAKLIRNALEAYVVDIDSIAMGDVSYKLSKNDTLFSVYHSIYLKEGTISAIYGASLGEVTAENESRIYIDEECMAVYDVKNTDKYFGDYVKAYYRQEKSTDMGTLVFIEPKFPERSKEISIEDFEEFTNNTIKYYDGESRKSGSIRVDENAKIIYNGEIATTGIKSLFEKLNKGIISCKDSEASGKLDVIIIWDWNSYVFGQKDTENDVFYSKYDEPLNLEDYKANVIYNSENVPMYSNKIMSGDILAVASSKTGEAIKIIVSNKKVTGCVNALQIIDGKLCITIGENDFYADKKFRALIEETISLGKTYEFSVDAFGEIVFAKQSDADEMKFGYLVNYYQDEKSIRDKFQLRIFTADNNFIEPYCSENVKIDGIKLKTAEEIERAFNANEPFTPQLIRYLLNENGEISVIDTCYVSEKESQLSSLYRSQKSEQVLYKNNRFGLKTMTNGYATNVLFVPTDDKVLTEEESEFQFISLWEAGFESDNRYDIEAYKLSKTDDFPSVIVCRGGNLTQAYDEIILVDKIINKRKEDGNYATFIYGLQRTKFVEQEINEDTSFTAALEGGIPVTLSGVEDIEEGDLIRCMTNRSGRATKVNRLYDCSKGGLPTWGGVKETTNWYDGSAYNQFFQLSYGYVTEKGTQTVKWGYKNIGDFDEEYNLAILPIIVYDPSRKYNKVYSGTMDDIFSCETAGDNCSRIIFKTVHSNGSCAVIYNN